MWSEDWLGGEPVDTMSGRQSEHSPNWFSTTHWSVVLAASDTSSPSADEALARLCQTYWYPLYSFVRRKGNSIVEAEDLTQGFFARFLEKRFLKNVAQEKGKFRSFLLSALSHYMANEWDKSQTLKRGGGSTHVPLDTVQAEDRYSYELASHPGLEPGEAFDLSWAETLLAVVLERLRGEFESGGKGDRFAELKPFLLGEPADGEYSAVANRLHLSQQGVKSAVHRLRQRFRELVRMEIGHTVATSAEIDEELRHLIRLMTA
jgi:DNA-directed RNA polymerase specialized sigma24 family protein